MNHWPWKPRKVDQEKNLEAQVFLKHRQTFEASLVDCSQVLKNLREHNLIGEKFKGKQSG